MTVVVRVLNCLNVFDGCRIHALEHTSGNVNEMLQKQEKLCIIQKKKTNFIHRKRFVTISMI